MANPNLASASDVFGEVEHYQPTTTVASATANPANSGEIFQVTSIHATNTNGEGGTEVGVTVKHRKSVSGTPTEASLGTVLNIPAQASLELLPNYKWMLEDEDLQLLSTSDTGLDVVITYVRMS